MSDEDLELPYFLSVALDPAVAELQMLLPCMADTFETEDWSLFQKFSSMDSNLNIEDALKSELASICVWFLFTEVPPLVKERAACILAFISFGTKALKLPVDKMGVEDLVGRILTSGNTEVQRQVCLALTSLAECRSRLLLHLEVTLCGGIQDQLIQFACNVQCNPVLIYPVLGAIASLSQFGKAMRKQIFKTGLLHSWLVDLLNGRDVESTSASRKDVESIAASRKDDESILACTYRIVACIVCEGCNFELWGRVKEVLLPHITNVLHDKITTVRPLRGVALAMQKMIKYGSYEQIKDVVNMGGLELLFFACSIDDEKLVWLSVKAIQNILRCLKANAADEYDKIIKGYSEGWQVIISIHRSRFHNSTINRITDDLLDNYWSSGKLYHHNLPNLCSTC